MRFPIGDTVRLAIVASCAAMLGAGAAMAQGTPPAAPDDPVVATVDGRPIHLSDLKDAIQTLPDNVRQLPQQALLPMLLDQMIDARALVSEAHKTGLDKDPAVQRQVAAAEDRALQTAVLSKDVGPSVTDAAVRARYDQEIAGKPGEDEVHAKHILVDNEADAKKIIAELNGGADFATLAKKYSKDPTAAEQGGDLGFFKKEEMVPEFSAAAFELKPGTITQTPVHSQFGWHVILVVEHRAAPPPSYEKARDELRQKMIQEGVQQAVAKARASVTVEKFNLDGSPIRATDQAEPPPPPK